MAFLGLCKDDPLVGTLSEVFGANIVRVPEERIRPLSVVSVCDGRSSFRGELAYLVKDLSPPDLDPSHLNTSRMTDLSGKRSRKVSADLGLQILDGFLRGFGVPSAGIQQKLTGASQVSFSFKNVQRMHADVGWLGHTLSGHAIDKSNAAAAICFGEDGCEFLVIDSVITSSDFSISVDRTEGGDFHLDIPAIQQIVTQAQAGVRVSSASSRELTFQGDKQLAFAFSCVRLCLDDDGKIVAMPRTSIPTACSAIPAAGWSTVPTGCCSAESRPWWSGTSRRALSEEKRLGQAGPARARGLLLRQLQHQAQPVLDLAHPLRRQLPELFSEKRAIDGDDLREIGHGVLDQQGEASSPWRGEGHCRARMRVGGWT